MLIRNYVTVAVRSFLRHKVYAVINVFGLALGLTVCAFIFLFVRDEVSYESYNPNASQTFRLLDDEHAAHVAPFLPIAAAELPEIDAACRVYPMSWSKPLLRSGDRAFYESRVFFVDSSFFDVFGYSLRSGDQASALSRPFTMVLSESTARRYFGDVDPVGQTFTYDGRQRFEITGVVGDADPRSHLQFDVLGSFATLNEVEEEWGLYLTWSNHSIHDYLRLTRNADPRVVAEHLYQSFHRHADSDSEPEFRLQPIADIHLHPAAFNEFQPRSDIAYVYIFSLMAVMVLVIACVNFTNLATARASTRTREVGIRKALGAGRRQLLRQFLGDAVMMSLVALALAAVFVWLLLPTFNAVAGKSITPYEAFSVEVIAVVFGIAVAAGLGAGLYPALLVSRYRSAAIMKRDPLSATGGRVLRKALVVVQFAMAILLLVGTLVASLQLTYLRSVDTGLTSDPVIVVPMTDRSLMPRVESLEAEMQKNPNVVSVSTSHRVPGEGTNGQQMSRPGGEPIGVRSFGIDDDFLTTYDVGLLAGRTFRDASIDTAGTTVILNETAVRAFGWSSPTDAIGQVIETGDEELTIVGVAGDFNFQSLRTRIQPLVLFYYGFRLYLSLRVKANDLPGTVAYAGKVWSKFSPGFPMSYYFLDAQLDAQYRAEERIEALFRTFAGLAILIACLGLFGLAAFGVQRRMKEMGVRKALGATSSQLLGLMSREYAGLILIAWVLAVPAAFVGARIWMSGFAYQAHIGVWPYLVAGLGAIAISWLAVSFQSMKAAAADPAEVLRYE